MLARKKKLACGIAWPTLTKSVHLCVVGESVWNAICCMLYADVLWCEATSYKTAECCWSLWALRFKLRPEDWNASREISATIATYFPLGVYFKGLDGNSDRWTCPPTPVHLESEDGPFPSPLAFVGSSMETQSYLFGDLSVHQFNLIAPDELL